MNEYNLKEIWEKLIDKLKIALSDTNIKMFIKPITPLKLEGDVLYSSVPSSTLKTHIQQNYLALILVLLNEITNNNNIRLEIAVDTPEKMKTGSNAYVQTPLFQDPASDTKENETSNLNPNQRFETFVVGNSNRFATAAAQAVAANPGTTYNPLFIYGNSGLGKTHLMQAIGNEILKNTPSSRVKYVTSEIFTNEIINAIQNHTVKDFQEKYRTIDCLIIDDIQFLENKERTQEEFFHTFNTLKNANKQIVISSDRHPQYMNKLEERLRSRFVNGLMADIQPPDLETRIAILRKKAESLEDVNVPNEVIQTIAASIDNNIRMIEGAFNKIVAYAHLMGIPVDLAVTAKVLEDFGTQTRQQITMDKIITIVCQSYHIQLEDLMSKKRPKNIAVPRQIAMYLCRKLTETSLPKIGMTFGGRDHTTVIHAFEKIQKLRETDMPFDKQMQQLEENIRQNR